MAKIKVKKNKKQTNDVKEAPKEENVVVLPPVRMSDDPTPKQVWRFVFRFRNQTYCVFINVALTTTILPCQ